MRSNLQRIVPSTSVRWAAAVLLIGLGVLQLRGHRHALDWPTLWATSVHTAGYLLVTAILAIVVYERAAVRVVRRAWINFDLVWAAALVLTGVAVAIV